MEKHLGLTAVLLVGCFLAQADLLKPQQQNGQVPYGQDNIAQHASNPYGFTSGSLPGQSSDPYNTNMNYFDNQQSNVYNPQSQPPTGYNSNSQPPTGYNSNSQPPTGYNSNSQSPTGYNSNSQSPTGYNSISQPPTGYNPHIQPPNSYKPPSLPPNAYNPHSQPPNSYNPPIQPPNSYNPPIQPPNSYNPPIQPPNAYNPHSQPPNSYNPHSQPPNSYYPHIQPPNSYQPPSLPPNVYNPFSPNAHNSNVFGNNDYKMKSCAIPTNFGQHFQLSSLETGYPTTAIQANLTARSDLAACLIQDIVTTTCQKYVNPTATPLVIHPGLVNCLVQEEKLTTTDPFRDLALSHVVPICLYIRHKLWSYVKLSGVQETCWLLRGFQDNVDYARCLTKKCSKCKSLDFNSENLCLPSFRKASVWVYCTGGAVPVIKRETITVQTKCSCKTVRCSAYKK